MEGQFDDYVKNIKTKNALSYVDHLESYLLEALNTSNSQYVSEAGNIERWKGGVNKKKLKEEITKNISEFREEVKKIQNKK
jgi:DNA gyrase/topoisomerase IV subunit B